MGTISVPENIVSGFRLNTPPADFRPDRDLPVGLVEFLGPLHDKFSPWRTELANERKAGLRESHAGVKPVHRYPGPAVRNGWFIELPDWCQDQRNQMTGPANDAELVVKMLNSGAPGVMLDLEDSTVNEWEHQRLGAENILAALRGTLTYADILGQNAAAATQDQLDLGGSTVYLNSRTTIAAKAVLAKSYGGIMVWELGQDALGDCVWRFGGPLLPGTTNTFGGNSVTEYGPILQTLYPRPTGPVYLYNNFHRTLNSNPCPS